MRLSDITSAQSVFCGGSSLFSLGHMLPLESCDQTPRHWVPTARITGFGYSIGVPPSAKGMLP